MEPAIYRERDVLAVLWRLEGDALALAPKLGNFPAPIQLGPNTVAWRREEVEDMARMAARARPAIRR